jgi:hypothetical protein
MSATIKVLLFTDREVWLFMNDRTRCLVDKYEECKNFLLYGGRHVFNIVRFYDDIQFPKVRDAAPFFQGWPPLWLKRTVASMYSPFARTMLMDADVYVCPHFETMFNKYIDNHHLYAASIAIALFAGSGSGNKALRPGMPEAFARFPERNLGFQIVHTGQPRAISLLALFRDVYVRHINDESIYVKHDQPSFREALFTVRPTIHDAVIPPDVACRMEGGCDDGCLTVHRHWDRDKSGDAVGMPRPEYRVKYSDEKGGQ